MALWCQLAWSVELDDLYQSAVKVDDQSRQTRQTAQKEALSQVLVKVSGSASVLDNGEVKQALRRASSYLRQYQFTQDDQGALMLLAQFDEAKINKLLRTNYLPIWGKRRPSILLWMAGEDPQSGMRQVVSKESYDAVREQILKVSDDRGLPVIFPLYDLVDNQEVSVSDVWGYFFDHIRRFAPRYHADAMVISRFWATDEPAEQGEGTVRTWHLQWRLYEQDTLTSSEQLDGELAEIVPELVNNLADNYARQYAVDASKIDSGNRLVLTVTNVGKLENLIDAERLLLSFSAVSDVLLKSVKGEQAQFEITLLGESLDLLQGLELEKRFQKVFDPLAQNPEDEPLVFRWVP